MNMMPLSFALAALLSAGTAIAAPPPAASPLATPGVDEAPVSLTPEALAALRERVMVQCGLGQHDGDALPWYFHFEFGRQLLQSGDARRAAAHLGHAVALNPTPGDDKRMYGQWYVDYLPYTQLATAQARLGNWPCASNALALAQASGETRKATFDRAQYDRVSGEVAAHRGDAPAASATACRKEDVAEPGYDVDAR